MVRRTIRPFTVEVRGSRRKADAPTFSADEQPHVAWPDALLKELHEDRAEMVPEVVPEKPQGRILPALTEPEPPRVTHFEPLAPPLEPEPELHDEPDTAGEDPEDDDLDVPAPAEAPDAVVRGRRPRKARETFPRGERWKARLPAAIHGIRRKPRGSATD